jgi:hypothetical protein
MQAIVIESLHRCWCFVGVSMVVTTTGAGW